MLNIYEMLLSVVHPNTGKCGELLVDNDGRTTFKSHCKQSSLAEDDSNCMLSPNQEYYLSDDQIFEDPYDEFLSDQEDWNRWLDI